MPAPAARQLLCSLLQIEHPLLLAPMLNVSTPSLVAAASNSGGLGIYGASSSSPADLVRIIGEIRSLTAKPFGINLFVPEPHNPSFTAAQTRAVEQAHVLLNKFRAEVGMSPTSTSPPIKDTRELFESQIDTIIAERVPVLSLHFGTPSAATFAKIKASKTVTIATATNVAEARELEQAGADIICAQGTEAGGHHGTFIGDHRAGEIGLLALIPEICNAVTVPVVAAGGIMTGSAINAVMQLGAAGAQLGTAFLTCPESNASAAHVKILRDGSAQSTILTQAFTGRVARGLATSPIIEALDEVQQQLPNTFCLAARDLFAEAKKKGRPELSPMWAGQGFRQARELPAGELFEKLLSELKAATKGV
ncbi:hypothetical protein HDU87_000234 [Geranomyces variabilis]|uniref:Nitronate monooxygenase n=1 Tax=Geranomyces variabilis TaxID=109894 RepID=A0AAD5TRX0_9FUNG|nr:hypothetical protein HDU87_000234 [Geranomyces variabilis]